MAESQPVVVLQQTPTAIPNPLDAAGQVSDLVKALLSKNFWIRVAEFGIGVMLLAIGANALTKQATGIDPVRTGKKVALTAATVVPK